MAVRGVVFARDANTLRVAVEDSDESLPEDETWRVELSADEVARRRQKAAMQAAKNAKRDRLAELRDVLMGRREPEFGSSPTPPLTRGVRQNRERRTPRFSGGLTGAGPQRVPAEAVALALAAKDLAIIHGPPGTGKTTAVVELIRQAVARGERVLACAPSNLAVDNLLEKLLAVGESPVRLGHPARVSEPLREHTLDVLVERHPDARQARKFYKEALRPVPQGRQVDAGQARARRARQTSAGGPGPHRRRPPARRRGPSSGSSTRRRSCAPRSPGSTPEVLGQARVRPGGDRRGVPDRRAGLLGAARPGERARAGRRPLPVAADGPVPRSGPAGARRQPDGAARRPVRRRSSPAGCASSTACTRRSWASRRREFYEADLEADESVEGHRLCELPGVSRPSR